MTKRLSPACKAVAADLRRAYSEQEILALLDEADSFGSRGVPIDEWPSLVRALRLLTPSVTERLLDRSVLQALMQHPLLDAVCRRLVAAAAVKVLDRNPGGPGRKNDALRALVDGYQAGMLTAGDEVTERLVAMSRQAGDSSKDRWRRLNALDVLVHIPGLAEEVLLDLANQWRENGVVLARIAASPAATPRVIETILTPRPTLGERGATERLVGFASVPASLRHPAIRSVLWAAIRDQYGGSFKIFFATALAPGATGSEIVAIIQALVAEEEDGCAAARQVVSALTAAQVASLSDNDLAMLLRTEDRFVRTAIVGALGRLSGLVEPARSTPRQRRGTAHRERGGGGRAM